MKIRELFRSGTSPRSAQAERRRLLISFEGAILAPVSVPDRHMPRSHQVLLLSAPYAATRRLAGVLVAVSAAEGGLSLPRLTSTMAALITLRWGVSALWGRPFWQRV